MNDELMGRVLRLPTGTPAGDAAAMRAELVACLGERRPVVVEEMVDAVRRAGLAHLLEVGGVAVERRFDDAVRLALRSWADDRPLQTVDIATLRELGATAAAAGVPLARLLTAVNRATRAGWEYALDHAVALADTARRPGLASRLIGEMSVGLLEVVGRIEAEIAVGYSEAGTVSLRGGYQREATPAPH